MTENKRYIVHRFLFGTPMLIDREVKVMRNFASNKYGQILNLYNPVHHAYCENSIDAIITRTYPYTIATALDGYIYHYLMTEKEQAMCEFIPPIGEADLKIIETDDYLEAIKAMCEWVFKNKFDFAKWGRQGKYFKQLEAHFNEYSEAWHDYVSFSKTGKIKPPNKNDENTSEYVTEYKYKVLNKKHSEFVEGKPTAEELINIINQCGDKNLKGKYESYRLLRVIVREKSEVIVD